MSSESNEACADGNSSHASALYFTETNRNRRKRTHTRTNSSPIRLLQNIFFVRIIKHSFVILLRCTFVPNKTSQDF
ncbi:hypothetical protein RB195_021700 [Necator americanus]|uniref:Uncharacterized protein n=1 Tax=Necator americanus TaxID=51031 RepID=A0ABR1EEF0_NECAM